MAHPRVGIFFRVGETWLIDAVEVGSGESYGDAVEHGGHYDYWQALQPQRPAERAFRAHDYDYFPRGRVVYFPAVERFRIYVDDCITEGQQADLLLQFGLTDVSAEFEGTEDGTHYVCASCSPSYLE